MKDSIRWISVSVAIIAGIYFTKAPECIFGFFVFPFITIIDSVAKTFLGLSE